MSSPRCTVMSIKAENDTAHHISKSSLILLVTLLLALTGSTQKFISPEDQLEGSSVRFECNGSLFRWMNFHRVKAMRIYRGKKNILAQFLVGHNHTRLNNGARNWTVQYKGINFTGSRNRQNVSLLLDMHDTSCDDASNQYRCEIDMYDIPAKRSIRRSVRKKLTVLLRPMIPKVEMIPAGHSDFKDWSEQSTAKQKFVCTTMGAPGLLLTWMTYLHNISKPREVASGVKTFQTINLGSRGGCVKQGYKSELELTWDIKVHMHSFLCLVSYTPRGKKVSKMLAHSMEKTLLLSTNKTQKTKTIVLGPPDGVVHEKQRTQLKCDARHARGTYGGQVVKLVLSWTWHPSHRKNIAVYDPFVKKFKKSTKIMDNRDQPDSKVTTVGAGSLGDKNNHSMGIDWIINSARCVGLGTYTCSAWYYDQRTHGVAVTAAEQMIDFRCGIKPGEIYALNRSGGKVQPYQVRSGQNLVGLCNFVGPQTAQFNITQDGITTTFEKEVKRIKLPTGGKEPTCLCYTHTATFNISLPENVTRSTYGCELSTSFTSAKVFFNIDPDGGPKPDDYSYWRLIKVLGGFLSLFTSLVGFVTFFGERVDWNLNKDDDDDSDDSDESEYSEDETDTPTSSVVTLSTLLTL